MALRESPMVPLSLPTSPHEALKVINYLSSNGVSLYVKNYNLETLVDGKVNPVAILICPLTGHKEGSKAFARYREIDKDTNRKTISLLE